MEPGQHQLEPAVTAYVCAIAFAVTFLIAIGFGCGLGTALLRGVVVLLAAKFLVPHLVRPAITSILDAMARDRAAASTANGTEESNAPDTASPSGEVTG